MAITEGMSQLSLEEQNERGRNAKLSIEALTELAFQANLRAQDASMKARYIMEEAQMVADSIMEKAQVEAEMVMEKARAKVDDLVATLASPVCGSNYRKEVRAAADKQPPKACAAQLDGEGASLLYSFVSPCSLS